MVVQSRLATRATRPSGLPHGPTDADERRRRREARGFLRPRRARARNLRHDSDPRHDAEAARRLDFCQGRTQIARAALRPLMHFVMAGLVTASRVYPTCGILNTELGQARVPLPSRFNRHRTLLSEIAGSSPAMTGNQFFKISF